MKDSTIKSLKALEILDSRGNPTVRVLLELEDGTKVSSSVPSGASTGEYQERVRRLSKSVRPQSGYACYWKFWRIMQRIHLYMLSPL